MSKCPSKIDAINNIDFLPLRNWKQKCRLKTWHTCCSLAAPFLQVFSFYTFTFDLEGTYIWKQILNLWDQNQIYHTKILLDF